MTSRIEGDRIASGNSFQNVFVIWPTLRLLICEFTRVIQPHDSPCTLHHINQPFTTISLRGLVIEINCSNKKFDLRSLPVPSPPPPPPFPVNPLSLLPQNVGPTCGELHYNLLSLPLHRFPQILSLPHPQPRPPLVSHNSNNFE